MRVRVLILGATGMAGHIVYHYLNRQEKYEVFNTVFRSKVSKTSVFYDVNEFQNLTNIFDSIKPDYIINCIGSLIRESVQNPSNAILVNAFFPHFLSKLSEEHNAKVIHISTDCVFSGNRGNYSIDDFRDADDTYGRSKALGELINDKDITLRTSIIGPELKKDGEGLMHWFLNQNEKVNGYINVFWSGITTLELAKVIDQAILFFSPGLYQIAPNEKISKYHLLKIISKVFEHKIEIEPLESKHSDKSLICSSLFNNYKISGYQNMLSDLRNFIIKNQLRYPNDYFK